MRKNLSRYMWIFTVGLCVYMYVININLCIVGQVHMSISMCKCIFLCTCVYLFVYVIVHEHICTFFLLRPEDSLTCCFSMIPILIFDTVSDWDLKLELCRLTGQHVPAIHLSLPLSMRLHSCATTSSNLLKVLGIKLRPSNSKQRVFY